MKAKYIEPDIEIVKFISQDIITESGNGENNTENTEIENHSDEISSEDTIW